MDLQELADRQEIVDLVTRYTRAVDTRDFAALDEVFTPDAARATAYFTKPMVSVAADGTETLWEVGGYYHHELVRRPEGWRSRGIRDDVVWTRGC